MSDEKTVRKKRGKAATPKKGTTKKQRSKDNSRLPLTTAALVIAMALSERENENLADVLLSDPTTVGQAWLQWGETWQSRLHDGARLASFALHLKNLLKRPSFDNAVVSVYLTIRFKLFGKVGSLKPKENASVWAEVWKLIRDDPRVQAWRSSALAQKKLSSVRKSYERKINKKANRMIITFSKLEDRAERVYSELLGMFPQPPDTL